MSLVFTGNHVLTNASFLLEACADGLPVLRMPVFCYCHLRVPVCLISRPLLALHCYMVPQIKEYTV